MQYIIYGFSDVAERLAKKITNDGDLLLYYCDGNDEIWDNEKRIFGPSKILENPEATVVICCTAVKPVVEMLREMGVENRIVVYPFLGFHFYYNKYEDCQMDSSYEYYYEVSILGNEQEKKDYIDKVNEWTKMHEKELWDIYENDDEYTARLLTEIIRERKMSEFDYVSPEKLYGFHGERHYFYDKNLAPKGDITFVDGGAFDGDTVQYAHETFGERLKCVYAFEPDEKNFRKLEGVCKQLSPTGGHCFQCGMWDDNTVLSFDAENTMSSNFGDAGSVKVPVKRIDDCLAQTVGDICIKMDIEGSEKRAIIGASNTIKKHSPYMAICVYHQLPDILEIPKTIKSINPNYKFYLRAGMHTECYAVPIV